MKNILSKKCLVCGDVFWKRETESRRYWGTKKYCSQKCSLVKTSIQTIAGNFWKGKKIPIEVREKISQSCKGRKPNKGSFYKGQHSDRKGKKYPERSGEKHWAWKEKTIKNCPICQKEMILAPWEKEKKFCSLDCRGLAKRGKDNPRYKGDKAVAGLKIRVSQLPEYKKWRKSVLERDEKKCLWCGCDNLKELQADHIKSFLEIVEKNGIMTIEDARNCIELWDISNGRTLCRICHRTTETYGRQRTKNYKSK